MHPYKAMRERRDDQFIILHVASFMAMLAGGRVMNACEKQGQKETGESC